MLRVRMHETPEDLRRLQRLLDQSYAEAGEHLRSIFTPERRMSADELVRALPGVFVLHLGTVTASAEPIVAPIDGMFYRGRLWFGFPPGAVRIRHVRARPQVSAVYSIGEDLCVIAHGTAREVRPSDPEHAEYEKYGREVYGPAWDYWADHYSDRQGSGLTACIEPRRMYAALMRPEVLPDLTGTA